MLTSLSRRGGFIETSDAYTLGQPIRLEFKIDARSVSVFANVTKIQDSRGEDCDSVSAGVEVIFYEVDDLTDTLISDAVEKLWMRYRP